MSTEITDFGEKIGGARKDLWKDRDLSIDDIKDLNTMEKFKYVNKKNVWKKPDFKIMVDKGMTPTTAFLLKKIYDSYPATLKPTTDEIKNAIMIENYIKFTEVTKKEYEKVTDIKDFDKLFNNIFVENGYLERSLHSSRWTDKVQEINSFMSNKFIKAAQVRPIHIRNAQAEVEKTNFPDIKEAWRKNIILKNLGTDENRNIAVCKKNGYTIEIIKDKFMDEDAAEKYIQTELKKQSKQNKKIEIRPQLEKIERRGKEYRNGKDATTDDFLNNLKFRGGEFGNWNNQADRRQNLNFAYDALSDLANVLEIKPKDISLNGSLAIAFGARGKGRAQAHYEPAREVINLTKMSGAGCLAHEWGHALDHYLGKLSGNTSIEKPLLTQYSISKANLDEDLKKSFTKIMDTILRKPKTKEEIEIDLTTDLNKSKKNLKRWLDQDVISDLKKEVKAYGSDEIKRRKATEPELKKAEKLIDEIINNPDRKEKFNELNILYKNVKKISIQKNTRDVIDGCVYWVDQKENTLKNIDTLSYYRDTDFYKIAKKFDENRKPYFSTKPELFARAFESYVQDKIYENGNRSDYLVYGTNNVDCPAYPLGEERKNINKAMNEFLEKLNYLEKDIPVKQEEKEMSLEDYYKIYEDDLKSIKEQIQGLDAFKCKTANGFVIVSPSAKEPGKIQLTTFINGEPFSDAQLESMDDVAKRLAEDGNTKITEKIKFKLKPIGNISYNNLNELDGKNFVIRTTKENLSKIEKLSIPYTVFVKTNYCNLVVKEKNRVEVMEALGLRDKEISKIPYDEFKNKEGANRYITVKKEEFEKLKESNIDYAAFDKVNTINVVVKDKDLQEALNVMGTSYEKQVGNTKYTDLKNSPGNVIFRIYSEKDIEKLIKSDIKFAAFNKGNDQYNVAFKENELEKVNKILNKTKTKHLER